MQVLESFTLVSVRRIGAGVRLVGARQPTRKSVESFPSSLLHLPLMRDIPGAPETLKTGRRPYLDPLSGREMYAYRICKPEHVN